MKEKKKCRTQDKDKHSIKKRETKMGGNLLSYFRETCLVVKWSDRVDMTGGSAFRISNICTGLSLG